MALDMQEHHAFEHEEGRSPVWIGMVWGVVSLLGGAALLAAMLTFDVREIGWSYLNGSGQVIPGTSNVLGTVGLYGAGIFLLDAGRHGLDAGCSVGVVGALPSAPLWKTAPQRGLRRFVPAVVRMPVSGSRACAGK